MLDAPYLLREVGPEIIATMTAATSAVVNEVEVPVGIQVLAGANRAALSIAHAAGGGRRQRLLAQADTALLTTCAAKTVCDHSTRLAPRSLALVSRAHR